MSVKSSLWKVVLAISLIALTGALLFPYVRAHRQTVTRRATKDRLQQIMLALHNYHEQYKTLPPAVVKGPDGRMWHSWRTLILPFLGEQELAAKYHFDEPWDGPHNRELSELCPKVFQSPDWGEKSGQTNFYAVIDRRTAWPAHHSTCYRQATDGTSYTLLVVEGPPSATWLEPRDMLVREWFKEFRTPGRSGSQVGLMDGSVRFLSSHTEQSRLQGLLTPCGGQPTYTGDWPEEFNETAEPEAAAWKTRDVSEMRDTDVLAAASTPVNPAKNQIWCATSQIAWDELRKLMGGAVVTTPSPSIVQELNAEPFDRRALSPETYFAVTTGASAEESQALVVQLQKKFPEMVPMLRSLPDADSARLRLFACLQKRMQFPAPFERFTAPLSFRAGGQADKVTSFGQLPIGGGILGEPVLVGQVEIGDYISDDDFIVVLSTVGQQEDQVILAHAPVGRTLRDTWTTIDSRLSRPHPHRVHAHLHSGERLEIPILEFGVSKSFEDLVGLTFGGGNSIDYAKESMLFRLDEYGAEVFAVAEMGVTGSMDGEAEKPPFDPTKPRSFIFNRPFCIALREKNAEPYFLGWIARPEVMVRFQPTP